MEFRYNIISLEVIYICDWHLGRALILCFLLTHSLGETFLSTPLVYQNAAHTAELCLGVFVVQTWSWSYGIHPRFR